MSTIGPDRPSSPAGTSDDESWQAFVFDGSDYQMRLLDGMAKAELGRRIAPVVACAAGLARSGRGRFDSFDLFTSVISSLAQMRENDVDYALDVCLSTVQRQGPDRFWQSVWNAEQHAPSIDDLGLRDLIGLTALVVLKNFESTLAQSGSAPVHLAQGSIR